MEYFLLECQSFCDMLRLVKFLKYVPLSKAILILSTSSCSPAILYKPSTSIPAQQIIQMYYFLTQW